MIGIFGGGHWELVIILAIALLLFGHRIPGMARALGSGITEFKRGLKSGEDDKALPENKGTDSASSQKTSNEKTPAE